MPRLELKINPACWEIEQFPLPFSAGEIVYGSTRGRLQIRLLDTERAHIRLLTKGFRADEEFMFETSATLNCRIEVRRIDKSPAAVTLSSARALVGLQTPPDHYPESPRLQRVVRGEESPQAFWQAMRGNLTPLLECIPAARPGHATKEYLASFLWRGAQHNVHLLGAPNGGHAELHRLGTTDIWFRTYRLPANTCLAYKLAPDVPAIEAPGMPASCALRAKLQRDPLNPLTFPAQTEDIFDGESILELPAAPRMHELHRPTPVHRGNLHSLHFSSSQLQNTREIHLYRSANYRDDDPERALLILLDGELHFSLGITVPMLDSQIACGALPNLAALLVCNPSNQSRAIELPPNPQFSRFLGEELIPWALRQRISAPVERTVISGASYGGLAATYAGLSHPQWFGKVLSQSGSFWWAPANTASPEWLSRNIPDAGGLRSEFRLEAGLFEVEKNNQGILHSNRRLCDALRAKNYTVDYAENPAGHDWLHWSRRLPHGLVALIGREAASHHT